jgi:tRNA(Ile)-lysidine synthase
MTWRASIENGFVEHLRGLGVLETPGRWVVALSGGCDSVVLLHLLHRNAADLGLHLTAAHLDHAMRPESAEDATWVADLCADWGVPLLTRRLETPPTSEDSARRARHAFLREVAREDHARWVAMGHHADDQAETVLFRALRGTGLEGLSGMPAVTRGGIVRPLLPFWRREIEAYAREHGLHWRTDATNRSLEPARNRIRHELIPLAEGSFAPAARLNLVRLAALAREAEGALSESVRRAEEELVTTEEGAFLLARSGLRVYDSGIGARLLRHLLRRLGVVLDRAGTRATLQFIRNAPSGRVMYLPSGVRVRLDFDGARIERDASHAPDQLLEIGEAEEVGEGEILLSGRRYRATWRVGEPEAIDEQNGWTVALSREDLRFPLLLRGWGPGDRMRTSGGSKTLKKLFLEHRVPRTVRARLPVLVDGSGRVLWVGGIPRPPATPPVAGRDALILSVLDA